eukprot:Clim_evm28s134 gene=Clim_evmTU28s134
MTDRDSLRKQFPIYDEGAAAPKPKPGPKPDPTPIDTASRAVVDFVFDGRKVVGEIAQQARDLGTSAEQQLEGLRKNFPQDKEDPMVLGITVGTGVFSLFAYKRLFRLRWSRSLLFAGATTFGAAYAMQPIVTKRTLGAMYKDVEKEVSPYVSEAQAQVSSVAGEAINSARSSVQSTVDALWKSMTEKTDPKKVDDAPQGDPGQSQAKDKDMYTRRG